MAKVTLKFADTVVEEGRYQVDLNVEDSRIDDGFATAAHVTGLFISQVVSTPEFAAGLAAFGKARGVALRLDGPTTTTIELNDTDTDTGQFEALRTLVEGEEVVDNAVTAATLAAHFIQTAMSSREFQQGCTEFAHNLVGDCDATVNEPPLVAENDTITAGKVA